MNVELSQTILPLLVASVVSTSVDYQYIVPLGVKTLWFGNSQVSVVSTSVDYHIVPPWRKDLMVW